MITKSYFLKILMVILSVSILFPLGACNKEDIRTDVPQAYVEILQKYELATSDMDSYSFEEKYNNGEFNLSLESSEQRYKWLSMIADLENSSSDSFGYILKDINGNSVEELFLVRGDHTVLAVFTIVDDKPLLLDAFWSKNKGFILDTNEIYVLTSESAQNFEYAIKKINDSGNSFKIERSFGCNAGVYYEFTNNQKSEISHNEFENLLMSNPLKNGTKWNENPITPID